MAGFMSIKIKSKYLPIGNMFENGRLQPKEAAESLKVWKNFIETQLPLLRKLEPVSFSIDSNRQIVCFLQRRSPKLEFVILNALNKF